MSQYFSHGEAHKTLREIRSALLQVHAILETVRDSDLPPSRQRTQLQLLETHLLTVMKGVSQTGQYLKRSMIG